MKYTLDNLDFPVVAIGTQIIDGEVSFENHTILFKSRNNFNKFLAETNEIFGEDNFINEITARDIVCIEEYH